MHALIQGMAMDYEGRKSGETERSQDAEIQLGSISDGVKREGHVPTSRVMREALHGPLTTWTRSGGTYCKDVNVRV